jgi:RNA polymerase sigma-70 factor, ECF subfamily
MLYFVKNMRSGALLILRMRLSKKLGKIEMLSQDDVLRSLLTNRTKLLAYIRTIVISHHTAEDIHQEVVISSMHCAEGFQDKQHLFSWARRAAKTKAIDFIRRSGRQPKHFDPGILDVFDAHWDQMHETESSIISSALQKCLEKLPAKSRSIVGMRYTNKFSGEEIAKHTGMTVSSVYVTLSRIYKTLEDCVRRNLANA